MNVKDYRRALDCLRKLLDAIEAMDEPTRAAFLSGTLPSAPRRSPRALPAPDLSPDAIHDALVAAAGRAEAQAVLAPLKGPQLKALLQRLQLRAPSRATVAQTRDIIIAATVGTRSDAAAIRRA